MRKTDEKQKQKHKAQPPDISAHSSAMEEQKTVKQRLTIAPVLFVFP
jgi:hypothetical protein